jgi:hypothetical protein
MSRRARITLEPDVETTFSEDTAVPEPETGVTGDASAAGGAEDVAATAVVGRGGLDKSTIFKTVLAGLAVVAMVLIWKNRRP